MTKTATRTAPSGTKCPTCGAEAESGALICLECGSRITLAYRRPPSWRVPATIVTLIVLGVAAGTYLVIQALEDDAKEEVAALPEPRSGESEEASGNDGEQGAAAGDEERDTAEEDAAREEEAAERRRAARERAQREESAAPSVGGDGVRTWPEGEDAYTVVILAAEDRASGTAFAKSAAESGTPAGLLRADDYPSLAASTGFFIVFVGTYPNQVKADQAAARLGRRFQGAYPQFVNGSEATG